MAARQALITRLLPGPAAVGQKPPTIADLPVSTRLELKSLMQSQIEAIEQQFGGSSPLLETLRQRLEELRRVTPEGAGSTASVPTNGGTSP
jgi:hypothetical protein